MNRRSWISLAAFAVAITLGSSHAALAGEEGHHDHSGTMPMHSEEGEAAGHSHERAMLHGGQVAMTRAHHFETVFSTDGIRVYPYTAAQNPMQVGDCAGTVTLKTEDGKTQELKLQKVEPKKGDLTAYFCPGHPDATQMEPGICKQCGTMKLMAQDYLFAPFDLAQVKPGTMKAVFHLKGMDGKEKEAIFTQPVAVMMGEKADTGMMMHSEGMHSDGQSGGHMH